MTRRLTIRRIMRSEWARLWRFTCRHGRSAWAPEQFSRFIDDEMTSGLLMECGRRLIGLLLYQVRPAEMTLVLIGVYVARDRRRRGVGSSLMGELARHLQVAGRGRVVALISERDLISQLFLRANGLRAIRILRAACSDGADDGYLFEKTFAPVPGTALPCGVQRKA
jgi:ribosomal protein S18 acetylase RimI-like enzyme